MEVGKVSEYNKQNYPLVTQPFHRSMLVKSGPMFSNGTRVKLPSEKVRRIYRRSGFIADICVLRWLGRVPVPSGISVHLGQEGRQRPE